jgi:hypothetical protein
MQAAFHRGRLVLPIALLSVSLSAQAPSSFQDLAHELASKLAAAIAPATQVLLTILNTEEIDPAALLPIEEEIRRTLDARGVRTSDRDDAPTRVQVACTRNLRERVCAAEILHDGARSVIVVTRPLESRAEPAMGLSLELIPIFSQQTPMLDVAVSGDRLLVLDPERLALYEQTHEEQVADARAVLPQREAATARNGWKLLQSAPIARSRPWPRDVRGRLRVEGGRVTAWLPGVACRGAADLVRVTCMDERGTSWPIDIENTGVDAARNYFYTPEGLPFYAAAPLGTDAGARWLVAASTGELLFLDAARRSVGTAGPATDIVALESTCGSVVVAASTANDGRPETITSLRVIKRQLIPAAAPIGLPGRLTALWPVAEGTAATAIVHDASRDRYGAFHIRTACSR